jgi:Uma2 family endonuclease
MRESQRKYVVDSDDPRAPSQEAWDAMTPAERAEVLDSLPSELPASEAAPPEGDTHFEAVVRARDVLRGFFRRSGQRVWIANNLPVYYPQEKMFSPDVIAVVDTDDRSREHWTVSAEGQGLDVVIEILWSGRRKKDLRDNVERFARLGIPEYFIFDRKKLRLLGYRLPTPDARVYQPILPQLGAHLSQRLGLGLGVEGDKLRFYVGGASLPESAELIAQLDAKLSAAEAHAEAAEAHAEEEARHAEEAERKLADALAELEKLRGRN